MSDFAAENERRNANFWDAAFAAVGRINEQQRRMHEATSAAGIVRRFDGSEDLPPDDALAMAVCGTDDKYFEAASALSAAIAEFEDSCDKN